jgi:transketolase
MALYALLADKGFFDPAELDRFCRKDGMLGGHPEFGKVPGVEASTGALGHGLPVGIGHALAARMEKRASKVFVLMGDGESNEGSVWEAALSAGKHRLENLTVVIDYNKMQAAGYARDIQSMEPFADKWRAFNFGVREVDGHHVEHLRDAMRQVPFEGGKPSALICHTVKGKGLSFVENEAGWHHKSGIKPDLIAKMEQELQ